MSFVSLTKGFSRPSVISLLCYGAEYAAVLYFLKRTSILLQGNGSPAGLLHFPNIHASRLNDYEN